MNKPGRLRTKVKMNRSEGNGACGEVVYTEGAEDHRRQFNGKENDKATGLRYYGFRDYDSITLRWNSADPLYRFNPDLGFDEPQRMNLYTFSLNNPISYYDPDGRDGKRPTCAWHGVLSSSELCPEV